MTVIGNDAAPVRTPGSYPQCTSSPREVAAPACALVSHISRENCDPFGDPWGRLLAKESQSSLANSTGNLSSANYGEPSPALSNRGLGQGGYGEPPLGLSAASLPYDGGSPYA